ncbi:ubiquitin-like modifier-activating enzyme ATG7 isoform X2 [Dreissena polymorpha]|nr:ubiquitin-like modifier-activating enzyme ATG7 isoform X2 [Dreissena polymorpha]
MADNRTMPLQFAPFSSFLDGGFWHQLCHNKVNVYGLDDSARPINASYYNGDASGMPCRMSLEHSSFDMSSKTPSQYFRAEGHLYNKNTLEDFKNTDKKQLLDQEGAQVWKAITSGAALENTTQLSRLLLLTFADIKKYHFYYWFAFPCVCPAQDFTLVRPPQTLLQVFTPEQADQILERYREFQSRGKEGVAFFIIVEEADTLSVDTLASTERHMQKGHKVLFAFADPCTLEQHPGWPLRNYLALILHHWGSKLPCVDVVCFRYRSKAGTHDASHSLVLQVNISPMEDSDTSDLPKVVGWEKNERGKLGPRFVNLIDSLDPTRLAESAVDLNLKLMRWRLLPNLDLETVSRARCLLLGAGTLGCNVARCLLGWGVRTITLVDSGRVSYSNPVRQTLFVFDDCRSEPGGRPKAEAAAEALRRIFPGVKAEGVSLTIPMPGHAVPESAQQQTRQDVEKLASLVSAHDVVFLLLDTRESRWLPTVMAAANNKTVICAALGFDTFLVMRHGNQSYSAPSPSSQHNVPLNKVIAGDQLGCYFCNDVVAPGDSTRDRTLDQQCTVSRPGMSFIASALAVELLVSVLQHPERGCAPADTGDTDTGSDTDCPLGLVPHQIRGFLSRFQQILPASRAFDKCTACSHKVIEVFRSEGFEFLLKAFNEPHYLEDLTGLTAMHQETAQAEVWDFDDEDSFSSMEAT